MGISCPPLSPGDDFQPCYLDVPSKPKADFLWSCIGSIVVSKRIKELFETLSVEGAEFCPVSMRKIGRRNARLPAPIPSTSEPEDLIDELPILSKTKSVGPYFELLVQTESGYAPGAEPLSICAGCGRESFSKTDKRFVMSESMWKGADIFFIAGSYFINVTDRLKLALQKLKATNIEFQKFEAFS